MRTLEHFLGIGKALDSIDSRMSALAREFKEIAPRGPIDDALIVAFRARSAELAAAAEALLSVVYDPTPPAPETAGSETASGSGL